MSGKANRRRRWLMGVMIVALSGSLSTSALAGATWHVDADAAPGGDGLLWSTAFQYVQEALENPSLLGGDEIWVAEGIYYPDDGLLNPPSELREATFALVTGVKIYGGFVGTETSLPQRDPETNITTLSGDLDDNDIASDFPQGPTYVDNAFHIVTAHNVGATAGISGFTITAANGHDSLEIGGGMRIHDCSPRVMRCVFFRNFAGGGGGTYRGGGLSISGRSLPVIANCSFLANLATSGSGVYSAGDAIFMVNHQFQNCLFSGNGRSVGAPLSHDGAAVYLAPWEHTVTLVNCTFSENVAGGDGAIWAHPDTSNKSLAIVKNCVFWDNHDGLHQHCEPFVDKRDIYAGCDYSGATVDNTCIANGWEKGVGSGNIDQNPMFCDPDGPDGEFGTTDDNLRLSLGSPCIDTGKDLAVPSDSADVDDDGILSELHPWDLNKQDRFFDAVPGGTYDVDMGAYEDQHIADCPADFNDDGDVDAFDLAILLTDWGPCPGCATDFDCDNEVSAFDLAYFLNEWGLCGEGFAGGGGGGSAPEGEGGGALAEALGVMGFDGVGDFNAWTATAPTDEAHAATQQLLELLTD